VSGRFRKFVALSRREKMLFFEALFFQLSVGLLLKILPFKMIPRLFNNRSSLKSHLSNLKSHISNLTSQDSPLTPHSSLLTPHSSPLTPHSSPLHEIKSATLQASHFSPWKNKCLVQSLAARRMMTRRGIHSQLSLGVTFDENKKMIAHAWLEAGDFEIVAKNGSYLEIYHF